MWSSLVELASFGAVTVGIDRLAGSGWAWIAAGVLGTIVGLGVNDRGVTAQVRRAYKAPLVLHRRAWRALRRSRPTVGEPSPHPPLIIPEELEEFARWAGESAERRTAAGSG